MYAITSPAEAVAALDYLPVAARASRRNPDSWTLAREEIAVTMALNAYLTNHLPEADANRALQRLGVIANVATWSNSYARTGGGVAWSEESKTIIRSLLAEAR